MRFECVRKKRMRQHGVHWLLLASISFSAGAVAQDQLGRLLTSPEERLLIARRHGLVIEEPSEQQTVRFDGVVEGDDGKLCVWVNGSRYDAAAELERMGMVLVVREGASVRLAVLTTDGVLHYLMPGQVFDRSRNRILEPWELEKALLAEQETKGDEEAGRQP